ncbi:AEC family transporter [Sphingobacterium shayense]|uniref:AEC family transporter n=1 Tax=Sphingobacterium shayense TaxID=626343 RepID=UPI001554384A|nr:AEC family transporter [Sphingobacterium shayense]NQD70840.1 AEC family transporter [Sphingobacterium shayense]
MSNFLIILFCLFAGYLLRRARIVKPDGFKAINTWILYIGLPAVSFKYLPGLQWDNALLVALISPTILLAGAYVFIKCLEKPLGLSARSSHTLILVSGLANTSFVGFPLVATYFGQQEIKWAIISDQSTFFLLSSVGTYIAIKGALGTQASLGVAQIAKRIVRFPPLVGCILALVLSRLIDLNPLDPFFTQLASTVSPLALFSIGMQLSFNFYRSEIFAISVSLFYKLILGPGLLILFCYFLNLRGEVTQVAIFEMAMPSLVATSLVLQEFRLNSKLGNSVIGLSILLGLLTTYIAYLFIIAFL